MEWGDIFGDEVRTQRSLIAASTTARSSTSAQPASACASTENSCARSMRIGRRLKRPRASEGVAMRCRDDPEAAPLRWDISAAIDAASTSPLVDTTNINRKETTAPSPVRVLSGRGSFSSPPHAPQRQLQQPLLPAATRCARRFT